MHLVRYGSLRCGLDICEGNAGPGSDQGKELGDIGPGGRHLLKAPPEEGTSGGAGIAEAGPDGVGHRRKRGWVG